MCVTNEKEKKTSTPKINNQPNSSGFLIMTSVGPSDYYGEEFIGTQQQ